MMNYHKQRHVMTQQTHTRERVIHFMFFSCTLPPSSSFPDDNLFLVPVPPSKLSSPHFALLSMIPASKKSPPMHKTRWFQKFRNNKSNKLTSKRKRWKNWSHILDELNETHRVTRAIVLSQTIMILDWP